MSESRISAGRSSWLPLTLVAELTQFETFEGEPLADYLPVLRQFPPIGEPLAELERWQRRFSHPSLRFLAEDLATLERDMQEVLEDPEFVAQHAADDCIAHLGGSWSLVMRLCEQCADLAARDARHGLAVARAATALAENIGEIFSAAQRRQLEALTWAQQGNAWRIPGHLIQAAECFERVKMHPPSEGSILEGIWAEIRCLEGSFLRDRRHLAEARAALHEGIQLAKESGLEGIQIRCLSMLASLDFEAGNHTRALAGAQEVLRLLQPEEGPRRYAEACVNLAHFLTRAGQAAAALEQLERHRDKALAYCRPAGQVRFIWNLAAALHGVGRTQEAIECYEEARRRFLEMQHVDSLALVTLELAIVHLEEGNTAEVRRLATEILPVFTMQGINREACATLALFREAALAERITLAQVRAWLGKLSGHA